MMTKKKEISGIQIGISSLVLIFVVLCLTVFAVLSLMSSMSEQRLAQKSLEATSEYYIADSLAEKQLKEIDLEIKSASETAWKSSFSSALQDKLGEMYDPKTGLISYEIPVNDQQVLCVDLKVINSGKYNGKRYNILRWQEVNTGEYEFEDSLPVWTGE